MKILRLVLLLPLVAWAVMGPVAAYRAYYQVRSIAILSNVETLAAGAEIRVEAITSGRTAATLRVELVQAGTTVTLAEVGIPPHRWRYWDPRAVYATTVIRVSQQHLEPLTAGPAVLRVSGYGRAQWLRVPPPQTREYPTDIRKSH